uniref:Uncharacterized protein n=1 Tax=Rhizophagus irregularis (strain DAOM 181602 / DAOM 197198 / MUCL 43194) TaxID=747089 RepID=U9SLT0_RHIID
MNVLTAILLVVSFITFKFYQLTKVPKGLKNVPTLSFLDFLITIYINAGPDKRWEYAQFNRLGPMGIGFSW